MIDSAQCVSRTIEEVVAEVGFDFGGAAEAGIGVSDGEVIFHHAYALSGEFWGWWRESVAWMGFLLGEGRARRAIMHIRLGLDWGREEADKVRSGGRVGGSGRH